MKYLIGAICAIIFSITLSFDDKKCEHVFTQVEQAEVKVEQSSSWVSAIYTAPPTGIHEGSDLICVKCFHKQKQIIDYGNAAPAYPGASLLNCCDTLHATSTSKGSMFLTGDTSGLLRIIHFSPDTIGLIK